MIPNRPPSDDGAKNTLRPRGAFVWRIQALNGMRKFIHQLRFFQRLKG